MATTIVPDPADHVVDGQMSNSDYATHERTFHSVLSVVKWFVIHLFIILIALYFGAIADQPVIAGVLVLAAIVLFGSVLLHRRPED